MEGSPASCSPAAPFDPSLGAQPLHQVAGRRVRAAWLGDKPTLDVFTFTQV